MRINRKTIRQSRYPRTSVATRSILVLLLAGGLLFSDAQAATLTVSDVTATAATLTISGHTGDWWYRYKNHVKKDFGPCTAVSGSAVRLSGLVPMRQYDVLAFSENTCTTVVASVSIVTPHLAESAIKPTGATLLLFNYTGDWWYQGNQNGASCTGGIAGSVYVADLAPETTYTYRAYTKSGCTAEDEIASATFTTQAAGTTTLTVSNVTATTATLTVANHTGAWWFEGSQGWWFDENGQGHTCTAVASGETSVDLTGLPPFVWYYYDAYDKDGCHAEDRIAEASWSQLGLKASDVTATTAAIQLFNYGVATWWHADQNGGACGEVAAGTTKADLTNLTSNTSYNWRAYSKSGCALADTIARVAFTTLSGPPAAPSGLTATGGDGRVTLTWDDPSNSSITGYEVQMRWAGVAWGAWTPIANSGSSTTSHVVADLTNDTEYRFHLRAVNAAGAGVVAPNASPWYVAATPTYIVAVRARNDQGDSGWRNSPAAGPFTPPSAAPPATPSSVSVTRSDGSLTASWPAVAGGDELPHHLQFRWRGKLEPRRPQSSQCQHHHQRRHQQRDLHRRGAGTQ